VLIFLSSRTAQNAGTYASACQPEPKIAITEASCRDISFARKRARHRNTHALDDPLSENIAGGSPDFGGIDPTHFFPGAIASLSFTTRFSFPASMQSYINV
jgi:hypothetical protein